MLCNIAIRHSELDSESRQLSPGIIGINRDIAILGRLDYRIKSDNDVIFKHYCLS